MKNFWAYYKALNMGMTQNGRAAGDQVFAVWAYVIGMFLYGILMSNIGGNSIPFPVIWGPMLCGGVAWAFLGTTFKPYLYSLLPITYGRKLVYFFLSCLLNFVVIAVAMFLFALIICMFMAVIVLAASGEWILVFEESADVVPDACAQGWGVYLASSLFLLGVTFAAGPCRRKLIRYSAMIVAAVVAYIPLKIYCVLGGIVSGELFIYFDTVNLSWVMLLIYCLAAAAALAFGIYRTVRYLRPANY